MLRTVLRFSLLVLIAGLGLVATTPRQTGAIFHLAAISEVMSGYDGNGDVQYMEIRMEEFGQEFVKDTLLSVFDEDGGPVLNNLLIVPDHVPTGGRNVRWLMATQEFADTTGLQPDFVFPPGFLTPKGLICWGAPDWAPPPNDWPVDNPATPEEEGWYVPAFYTDCVAYGGYIGDAPDCHLLDPPCSSHPPPTQLPPGDGDLALARLLPVPPVPPGTPGIGAFENYCALPVVPAGVSAQHLSAPPDEQSFNLCCPTPENNAGQFVLLGDDSDADGLPDCHEDEIGTTTGEVDTDQDGCADGEEVTYSRNTGGMRDPTNFWDFYDTPDAGNARDKIIAVADIFRVVGRFGTNGPNTTIQDAMTQPLATGYHAAFDRSSMPGLLSGAADGSISTGDILLAVIQFGNTCSAAP